MSAEQRETILTAAIETFARFGFKKTSVDDIARRAGIGKGTVYLHFASKEELFGAVLHRIGVKALADLEASVKHARTPQARVRAFLEGRERMSLQLAADLGISHASLVELLEHAEPHILEQVMREAGPLEETLEDGNRRGVFAVPSPRLLATGVSACLHAMDGSLAEPGSLGLHAALAEVYDVFVRGLAAETPQAARTETAPPERPALASYETPEDLDGRHA